MDEYFVIIRGVPAKDDGWSENREGASWDELQRGKCPDCGGDWVWFEAGYVSGTRKCLGKPTRTMDNPSFPDGKQNTYNPCGGCGSMFSAIPGRNPTIQRARFYQQGLDPGHIHPNKEQVSLK